MRIRVEPDRCIGSGVCVLTAPAVFDQNDNDGVVVLVTDTPPEEEYEAVREAEIRCPASVILIDG